MNPAEEPQAPLVERLHADAQAIDAHPSEPFQSLHVHCPGIHFKRHFRILAEPITCAHDGENALHLAAESSEGVPPPK